MGNNREVKLIAKWLLEGSRGGSLRAKILLLLKDKPMNPNQMARELKVNYRSITHHLKVLQDHGLVEKLGRGYGSPYTLTMLAEENWESILDSVNRTLGEEK